MVRRLLCLRFVFCCTVVCSYVALLAGCNVTVRGKQRPFISHKPIKGELELVAEKRTDEHKSPGINRKSVSEVFEERVKVETEGDMYHPNFLLYNAAIGLGLAQQTLDSDDESGYNNVTLKEYNVFAQLLRAKSLPSTVYLNRTEDLIARQFLGSLQTESVNSGFSLAWKSKDWPMRFQYDTSETKQDTLASMAEDFFRRDSERYKYSLSHDFSELSRMRFE